MLHELGEVFVNPWLPSKRLRPTSAFPCVLHFKSKRAGISASPFVITAELEAEPCSELAGERARQQAAGGIDESDRVAKRWTWSWS
jgi:hypothetical protein